MLFQIPHLASPSFKAFVMRLNVNHISSKTRKSCTYLQTVSLKTFEKFIFFLISVFFSRTVYFEEMKHHFGTLIISRRCQIKIMRNLLNYSHILKFLFSLRFVDNI